MTTEEMLKNARTAKYSLAAADTQIKNTALEAMAESLILEKENILKANAEDVSSAKGKISDVMIDRLSLDEKRIFAMAEGIREVKKLPDPVGEVVSSDIRPNGLKIEKILVPMGVIAIIYESRPNVTSDAAALAIKSGNACVLRCGKEAWKSSFAIVSALKKGLKRAGLSEECVNLIEDTSRESSFALMKASGYIDLLIPRGGAGLIKSCVENATVPCIATGTGICHVYVDEFADIPKAIKIIVNAKTSRPSVCNAEEVCLVNKKIAPSFLPRLKKALVDERIFVGKAPVELRCDDFSYNIIGGIRAGDKDFDTEFLDYILAVGVVENVDEAIKHIALHSTGHSEAIITENNCNAEKFLRRVDSAAVYVNASTRFTDGGEFGLGCEMGISTQKLHARGPMGLKELCSYKYVIRGDGQIR